LDPRFRHTTSAARPHTATPMARAIKMTALPDAPLLPVLVVDIVTGGVGTRVGNAVGLAVGSGVG
jgi:hypothetical protein